MLAHLISYPVDTTKKGREQSLKEHVVSTALLCSKAASKIQLEKTGYLTGLLHDVGKARSVFQEYLLSKDKSLKGKINHSAYGANMVRELAQEGNDVFTKLCEELIASAICSHHSGLLDILTPSGGDQYTSRIEAVSPEAYEEAKHNFLSECVSWEELIGLFHSAVCEIQLLFEKVKTLGHFGLGMVEKFLFSCLVDADRYDTYCFEAEITPTWYEPPNWHKLLANLEDTLAEFSQTSPIAKLRHEIADDCKAFGKQRCGVYQLFVPTGGGKTLSSLRFALEHCCYPDFQKEHIFYIIPYCSILEQNSRDIRDALKDDAIVLEHHSNVVFQAETEEEREELYHEYELLSQRWDNPIILTTMVQFLDTLFAGKTKRCRKLHQLANSVLIFDEIQSIPVKCIHLFNAAINFLSSVCNATVVLCTATQPQLSKTEPVTLKLSEPINMVSDVSDKFGAFRRTKIVDATRTEGMTYQCLAKFTLEQAIEKDSVLVILNTKQAVQSVYESVRSLPHNAALFLLSTNLCPAHRLEIIEKIKALTKSGQRVICISTQLIEAGVNLSFGCVIRSLAGLDNIAQSAGRCNRHGEYGQQREVYIVNLPEENIRSLPDIKAAQIVTRRVLEQYRRDPDSLGYDLLSPEAIELYYDHYYRERTDEMGYRCKKENYKLYDLLSDNKKGRTAYLEETGKCPSMVFYQAFQTAGELFRPIEEETYSIFVPYQKGESMIEELLGGCSLSRKKELLRLGMRYMVNVFSQELDRLCSLRVVHFLEEQGIYVLDKGFYDDTVGIHLNGQREFLCC